MASIPSGDHLTLAEYLGGPETNQRRELSWGIVREPPAPAWDHQFVTGRLFTKLDAHVTRFRCGKVGLSPIDVILDPARNLVVQPDICFITSERCGIIHDRIWGAPDLVVEVLSPDSRRYDREDKRQWYAQYGVRELWLVDAQHRTLELYDLISAPDKAVEFQGSQIVRSSVLSRLRLRADSVFE